MYYPQKLLQSHHKEILMNTTEELKKVITPCISVCTYNSNNYCIGCNRHMNEIFDWFDYDDKKRISIMEELIDRKIV
jgi:predicted Fe-S protein YdhL (DUF1289 family)